MLSQLKTTLKRHIAYTLCILQIASPLMPRIAQAQREWPELAYEVQATSGPHKVAHANISVDEAGVYAFSIPKNFWALGQTLRFFDGGTNIGQMSIEEDGTFYLAGTGNFSLKGFTPYHLKKTDIRLQGNLDIYETLIAWAHYFDVSGVVRSYGDLLTPGLLLSLGSSFQNHGTIKSQNANVHNFSNQGQVYLQEDFGSLSTWKTFQKKVKELGGIRFNTSAMDAFQRVKVSSNLDWDVIEFMAGHFPTWIKMPVFNVVENTGTFAVGGKLFMPKKTHPLQNTGRMEILSGGENLCFSGNGSVFIGAKDSQSSPKRVTVDLHKTMGNLILNAKDYALVRFFDMPKFNGDLYSSTDMGVTVFNAARQPLSFQGLLVCEGPLSILNASGKNGQFILKAPAGTHYRIREAQADSEGSESPFQKGDIVAKAIHFTSQGLFKNASGRVIAEQDVQIGGRGYEGAVQIDSLVAGQKSVSFWASQLTGKGSIVTHGRSTFLGGNLDLSHLAIQSHGFGAIASKRLVLPESETHSSGVIQLEGPNIVIQKSMSAQTIQATAHSGSVQVEQDVHVLSGQSISLEGHTQITQKSNSLIGAPTVSLTSPHISLGGDIMAGNKLVLRTQSINGGCLQAPRAFVRGLYSNDPIYISNSTFMGGCLDFGGENIFSCKTTYKADSIRFESPSLSSHGDTFQTGKLTFADIKYFQSIGSTWQLPLFDIRSHSVCMQGNRVHAAAASITGEQTLHLERNTFSIDHAQFTATENVEMAGNRHHGVHHTLQVMDPQTALTTESFIEYMDGLNGVSQAGLFLPRTSFILDHDLHLTHPYFRMTFGAFYNDHAIVSSDGQLLVHGGTLGSKEAVFSAGDLTLSSTGNMIHKDGTVFHSTAGDIVMTSKGGNILLLPKERREHIPLGKRGFLGQEKYSKGAVTFYTPASIVAAGKAQIESPHGTVYAPVLHLQSGKDAAIHGTSVSISGTTETYVKESYRTSGGFLGFNRRNVHREGVHFTSPEFDVGGNLSITATGSHALLDGLNARVTGKTFVRAFQDIYWGGLRGVAHNSNKRSSCWGGFITDKKSGAVVGKVATVHSPHPISITSETGNVHIKGLNSVASTQASALQGLIHTGEMDLPSYSYKVKRGELREAASFMGMMAAFTTALFYPPAQGVLPSMIAAAQSWAAGTLTRKVFENEFNPHDTAASFTEDDFKTLLVQVATAGFTEVATAKLPEFDSFLQERLIKNFAQEVTSLHMQATFMGDQFCKTDFLHRLAGVGFATLGDVMAKNIGDKFSPLTHNTERLHWHGASGAFLGALHSLTTNGRIKWEDIGRGALTHIVAASVPEMVSDDLNSATLLSAAEAEKIKEKRQRSAIYGKMASTAMHFLTGGDLHQGSTMANSVIDHNFLGDHWDEEEEERQRGILDDGYLMFLHSSENSPRGQSSHQSPSPWYRTLFGPTIFGEHYDSLFTETPPREFSDHNASRTRHNLTSVRNGLPEIYDYMYEGSLGIGRGAYKLMAWGTEVLSNPYGNFIKPTLTLAYDAVVLSVDCELSESFLSRSLKSAVGEEAQCLHSSWTEASWERFYGMQNQLNLRAIDYKYATNPEKFGLVLEDGITLFGGGKFFSGVKKISRYFPRKMPISLKSRFPIRMRVFVEKWGNSHIYRLLSREGDEIFVEATQRIDGKKLTLSDLSIDGIGKGTSSVLELRQFAKEVGRRNKVDQVVIHGGVRTTGAAPGHFPRTIVIKVNK